MSTRLCFSFLVCVLWSTETVAADDRSYALTVTPTMSDIGINMPAGVEVVLRNTGNSVLPMFHANSAAQGEYNYQVSVTNQQGNAASFTPRGQDLAEIGPAIGSMQLLRLQPGESYVSDIIVSDLFVMSQPGTYLITVSGSAEQFAPVATSNTVSITVHQGPRGDFNGDGVVDAQDLAILTQALNTMAVSATDARDLNSDGQIDAFDLQILTNIINGNTAANPADVNGDGKIDCADLAIIKSPAFGKKTGEPGFDPRADVNKDGVVDIKDWQLVFQQVPAATWAQCR